VAEHADGSEQRREATIVQVAAAAGVSPATVSRVVNGTQSVSAPLRKRVERALEEFDYQPNPMARALKGAKTLVIGVIISDFANPFFASVVRGVEEAALEAGYSVILCNTDENPEREARYLELLKSKRIDGVIVSPTHDSSLAAYRRLEGTPIVQIDRSVSGLETDKVRVDNTQGSYDAVSYLASLGHTRIATIAGPTDVTTGMERLRGYNSALQDAGAEIDRSLVMVGDFRQTSGYDGVRRLLELEPRPTALFVANNLMMLGAMIALNEANVRIPADMSVVGFDEVDWAQLSRPALTVVTQPAHDVGFDSAELLLRRIRDEGSRKKQTLLLSPELVVRESTAPPPEG
jgi:LacI family transcriptional regulator